MVALALLAGLLIVLVGGREETPVRSGTLIVEGPVAEVEIAAKHEDENVYLRPDFPMNVGWLWPPRHTPGRPVSLDRLQMELSEVHSRIERFYNSKDPAQLGNLPLWDPAIGSLNMIQALRVGLYHDQLHYDHIRSLLRDGFASPGSVRL